MFIMQSASENFCAAAACVSSTLLCPSRSYTVDVAAGHQRHALQIARLDSCRLLVLAVVDHQHRLASLRASSSAARIALGLVLVERELAARPSARRRAAWPTSAERSAPSCILRGQLDSCNRAVADRAPCRHAATAATGSNRCAPGPCPSASTASCPSPPLRAATLVLMPCRARARLMSAAPLRTAAPR